MKWLPPQRMVAATVSIGDVGTVFARSAARKSSRAQSALLVLVAAVDYARLSASSPLGTSKHAADELDGCDIGRQTANRKNLVFGALISEMRCTDYGQVLWAGVMPAFLVLDPATEELRVPLLCFRGCEPFSKRGGMTPKVSAKCNAASCKGNPWYAAHKSNTFPCAAQLGWSNGRCCAADRQRTFGLARSAICAVDRDRVVGMPSQRCFGIGAAHRGAVRPAVASPAGVARRSPAGRDRAAGNQTRRRMEPTEEDAGQPRRGHLSWKWLR
jgi:hypothetical protein